MRYTVRGKLGAARARTNDSEELKLCVTALRRTIPPRKINHTPHNHNKEERTPTLLRFRVRRVFLQPVHSE